MTITRRRVLHSNVGISFWGGIDPLTGIVIDPSHPLFGECVSGNILCVPSGRGSCTGSQVMLELILGGAAPYAILLRDPDAILAAGAMVAEEFFGDAIPPGSVPAIAAIGASDFARIGVRKTLSIDRINNDDGEGGGGVAGAWLRIRGGVGEDGGEDGGDGDDDLEILARDLLRLEGTLLDGWPSPPSSPAEGAARRIIGRVASVRGATDLVAVSSAHVDAVTYIGPGGLRFARRLVELGGRVRVP